MSQRKTQRQGCSRHRRLARHRRGHRHARSPMTAPTSPSAIRPRPTRPRRSSMSFCRRAYAPTPSRPTRPIPRKWRRWSKSVVERFGHLDILVNNAGVFATGPVHDRANNLAELDHLFAVNVGGVAAAVRAAAPRYERRRPHHLDRLGRRRRLALARRSPTIRPPRAPSLLIRAAGRATSGQGASPSTTSSLGRSIPT